MGWRDGGGWRGERGEGRMEIGEWRLEIEGRGMWEWTEIGFCYLHFGTNVLKMANH